MSATRGDKRKKAEGVKGTCSYFGECKHKDDEGYCDKSYCDYWKERPAQGQMVMK